MKNVLIVGGGLAGCTAASELSRAGIPSVLLESASEIGGKVREYGCKADLKCNQCGVCLTGNLFENVESDGNVTKYLGAHLTDIYPENGGYTACINDSITSYNISVSDIVIASGFSDYAAASKAAAELSVSPNIITGSEIEKIMKNRTDDSLFAKAPESVAFIMCFGSRDVKEDAQYCSRVCCGYSTRSAKVIKHYYPETEITMFYMDLQTVNTSPGYIDELKKAGIRFERCRPARIAVEDGLPAVTYESSDGLTKKSFEYVVLCGGIHPGKDNVFLSNISGLRVDEDGFLKYVLPPEKTHIYTAGCVSGPRNIRETAADARNAAAMIIKSLTEDGKRV